MEIVPGEPAVVFFVSRALRWMLVAAVVAGGAFLLVSGCWVARDLSDPGMAAPGIPERARDLHQEAARRIPAWARARIDGGLGEAAPLHSIPDTEWPVFTVVFFLEATVAMQEAGEDIAYAMPAVEASRELLLDEGHHSWVRRHWGEGYLEEKNLYFRSLIVAGLSCHRLLTGSEMDTELLRGQTLGLIAELDASPHGVLPDYPGQTYPIDVLPALNYLRRAADILDEDIGSELRRARRAFLAPYDADGLINQQVLEVPGELPQVVDGPRGTGLSWSGMHAPELWPEDAERWHQLYTERYWQDQGWAAGFREFAPGERDEWTFDIDSGPVVDGFGTASNAFGLAAARRNGRFDQAATLSAQMAALSFPGFDGSYWLPGMLSTDAAPVLGEAALAYVLTTQPASGVEVVRGGSWPFLVWFSLLLHFGGGLLLLWVGWRLGRRCRGTE